MRDYGERMTDRHLKRLEARIGIVYKQASKDISEKLEDFEKRHAARDAQLRQQLDAGKIAQADYEAWLRGQVFQRSQWQTKKDTIEDILYNADRAAQQMINDGRIQPFISNANYMVDRIGSHQTGVNFTTYDEHTVRRLIDEHPDILPPRKSVNKDKAYQYYNKKINTAITQGIIQGETVSQIARRISTQTGEAMSYAMKCNARTAYTGAQNAGRIEGMHQAQKLGINLRKKWLSAHDGHTRDAHVHLDGQVQDVDEPFESDLGEIMYPGDPAALPANVWNCRCTLIEVFPEYDQ